MNRNQLTMVINVYTSTYTSENRTMRGFIFPVEIWTGLSVVSV